VLLIPLTLGAALHQSSLSGYCIKVGVSFDKSSKCTGQERRREPYPFALPTMHNLSLSMPFCEPAGKGGISRLISYPRMAAPAFELKTRLA
jgi:hypothetical protein